ncbi:hypothetical protein JW756_00270 [Candidatus Woesearchaeota archaeon]|nr:hypothetical protein [Candidatus Woesearchaeota archaeon]
MQVNAELAEFSHEKRGMSPLIATMLLIAFAVALGAMIMNWSSTLGEKDAGGPDCSKVMMEISPYLCYAENMIKISVKNTGKAVEAVSLKIVDSSGETLKVLPDSKLASGEVMNRDVPFAKSGKTSLALTPSINYKGEAAPCTKPAIKIDDLPNC